MELIAITVELGTHYGCPVVMRVILIGTTIGIGAMDIVNIKITLQVRSYNKILSGKHSIKSRATYALIKIKSFVSL